MTAKSQPTTRRIRISDIRVGKRHRKDLGTRDGSLDVLTDSIADNGLFHPISVREDGLLLAGRRRLTACKRLGWTTIQANIFRCER